MKVEIQTGNVSPGRVLRVEVHRDDDGNVIMARLELVSQRTRRPRLGLIAPLSNTTAENRQAKFHHLKSFGFSPGGGGATEKVNKCNAT